MYSDKTGRTLYEISRNIGCGKAINDFNDRGYIISTIFSDLRVANFWATERSNSFVMNVLFTSIIEQI